MKLFETVKKFTDTIAKGDVESQLTEINQQAKGKYTELYTRMESIFKDSRSFKSKTANELQAAFNKSGQKYKDNFIMVVSKAVQAVGDHSQMLLDILNEMKVNTLARDALDYRTATVLQHVDNLTWYLEYARGLAIIIYEAEVNAFKQQPEVDAYSRAALSPRNVSNFITLTNILLKHRKDLKDVIYDMPTMIVNEDNDALARNTLGLRKVDALGTSGLFEIFNPLRWIYGVNRFFSDWKLNKLQVMKEDLEYLELRHQELIQRREGKEDARLEKIIENYKEEIEKKRYKIKKIEDSIKGDS